MILQATCTSGVSGDKFLGALLDIAQNTDCYDLARLQRDIDATLTGVHVETSRVLKCGIAATHVDVTTTEDQPHRRWPDIRQLIMGADIPAGAKERARKAFEYVAQAEAKVHGCSLDEVHFHEVGAYDSIVDIVGTSILLDALDVDEFYCTPLALGSGTVDCAHGTLPVPAPATMEIIARGIPSYEGPVDSELTTPTGAALVAANVTSFETLPTCTPIATGYGAGSRDFEGLANVLRLVLCESAANAQSANLTVEQVMLLSTNIDHISAEQVATAAREIMDAGAKDVWQEPIMMKKGRLAIKLCVICAPREAERFQELIHRTTGTLGVRRDLVMRSTLRRESITVDTPYGLVRFKAAAIDDDHWIRPENDDVERIAKETGKPYEELYSELIYIALKSSRQG